MNERELRQAIKEKQLEFEKAKKDNKNIEELRSIANEVTELREKLELELEMRANALPEVAEAVETPKEERNNDVDLEAEYTKVFTKVLRNNVTNEDMKVLEDLEKRAQDVPTATPYLQSKQDANGGFIVPKDVSTQINEYKRTEQFDLSTLIDVVQTSFTSGSRVFEKLAAQTAFANIDEWDKIGDIAAPEFEQKTYSMKSYAGILPIPRQLLQDTNAALMAHLAKFIARKSVFTRNSKIIEVLGTLTKRSKAVAVTDDLKDILNVELDGVFANNATIITNQDGYNWLDKCKDENGNYLMQRDVVNGTGYTIFGHRVVVVPNSTLASTGKKAPLYIGDLKEAVVLFDRGVYEITGTEIGGQAFQRNSYDIRIIDRFEVQKWDEAAVIATEIDTTKAPGLPSTTAKAVG
nr:MAG TPA: major capsid protein [Caudoviricetes sp.]